MDTLSFTLLKKFRVRLFLLFALGCEAGLAQISSPTIVEIETEHDVVYFNDVSDYAALASNPSRTVLPGGAPRTFAPGTFIGDIIAVNSKPATGTYMGRWNFILPSATIPPGVGRRAGMQDGFLDILQSDGTPVGTIMFSGFLGDSLEPSLATPQFGLTIVGGTGPFLGARGQGNGTGGERFASAAEDPVYRAINPVGVRGGKGRFLFHLIPMSRPEVVTTAEGPAVFHGSDFSLVTAAKPARAGETLIVMATNLGQTRPGLEPGKPFPEAPLQTVNAPLEVTLNGRVSEVINSIGWPGLENRYRVDIRLPDGTAAGLATLRLTLAWIPGPEVRIAVQ